MEAMFHTPPGKRKETLPPYSPVSDSQASKSAMSHQSPRSPCPASGAHIPHSPRVGIGTHRRRSIFTVVAVDYVYDPVRGFSGDMRALSIDMMRDATAKAKGYLFGGGSILGGDIHSAPEQMRAAPPPSYSASVKPMLLWLDGGGTKVVVETHFLEDLMHKLAWDLKFTTSQPDRIIGGEYIIPPKDCFDWIASCGCGTIIAFSIACGMRVKEIRAMFIEMTPSLRNGCETQLYSQLESLIPTPKQPMELEGVPIEDFPLAVNIWVPAEADVAKTPGIWYAGPRFIVFGQLTPGKMRSILKGEPLKARLLPLVMREVMKEWNGNAEFLDSTVSFLQDVCPIFDECSFLLSLGSGDVPRVGAEQGWWDWVWGQNASSVHAPLPPCLPNKRNHIIPPTAYSDPATYIRLSPKLSKRSERGLEKPGDWATDVTEILAMTSAYLSKEEVRQYLDRVNDMLKWKDIEGPRRPMMNPVEQNQPSTSRPRRGF